MNGCARGGEIADHRGSGAWVEIGNGLSRGAAEPRRHCNGLSRGAAEARRHCNRLSRGAAEPRSNCHRNASPLPTCFSEKKEKLFVFEQKRSAIPSQFLRVSAAPRGKFFLLSLPLGSSLDSAFPFARATPARAA